MSLGTIGTTLLPMPIACPKLEEETWFPGGLCVDQRHQYVTATQAGFKRVA